MTVLEAATRCWRALPEEIREELEPLRIEVMPRPTAELLEDGISETTPGAYIERGEEPFFDGDDEQDRVIYLFTANIKPLSQKAVEAVMLHEVGHAIGMEEDEVREAIEAPDEERDDDDEDDDGDETDDEDDDEEAEAV